MTRPDQGGGTQDASRPRVVAAPELVEEPPPAPKPPEPPPTVVRRDWRAEAHRACGADRSSVACTESMKRFLDDLGVRKERFLATQPPETGTPGSQLRRLKHVLKYQLKELTSLVNEYTAIPRYELPKPTVEAATSVGQIYEHMAEFLRQIPPPPNLTDAQVEIFREQLEQQATPLLRKAVAAYAKAMTVGEQFGVDTSLASAAKARLDKMGDAR